MLLIKLARLWGWAGDRCLDASDWCRDRARRSRASLGEIAIFATGIVLAVIILWFGVFA